MDYGNKLGKSIIFAKNHRHAEKILELFNRDYPAYVGWAQVIDNKTQYAQSAIDQFSDPTKLPQIAISVDMLDTGIDVPEVVNLVFFKKGKTAPPPAGAGARQIRSGPAPPPVPPCPPTVPSGMRSAPVSRTPGPGASKGSAPSG